MSTDPNGWLMSGGVGSAKFDAHGDSVKGTITETPDLRQQTDFDTNAPLFWDDGKPKMQLVVTLATDQRDPSNPDDDGIRRLYVKGKLQQAVAGAIRKAGAKGLEVGGTLTVAYIGDDEPKRKGMSGAKLYTADYASPAAASRCSPTRPRRRAISSTRWMRSRPCPTFPAARPSARSSSRSMTTTSTGGRCPVPASSPSTSLPWSSCVPALLTDAQTAAYEKVALNLKGKNGKRACCP